MANRLGKYLSVVLFAFAASSVSVFAESDPMAPGRRNVSFPAADGTQLGGYLAMPSGSGKLPAVLMIHEWWGLNNDVTVLADALAKQGFAVMAADGFRGKVAQTPQEAMQQVRGTPSAQVASDLDSALDYLKSQPRVETNNVAVMGFCFGGTQSMYMGTRRPDLSAVVILYGSGPITDPARLGTMKAAGPVLGIYGADDGNIPTAQVELFKKALDDTGVANTISIYPGVGHAFVKSSTYENGAQAEQAWNQVVSFLKKTL